MWKNLKGAFEQFSTRSPTEKIEKKVPNTCEYSDRSDVSLCDVISAESITKTTGFICNIGQKVAFRPI